MNTIPSPPAVGVADTAMASYDAALADANLHNYNLVAVSSVVPAEATVEAVEAAPDLGPAGNQLTVVEARRTVGPDDAVDFREGRPRRRRTPSRSGRRAAARTWPPDSAGATGRVPASSTRSPARDPDDVRERIEAGLDAGSDLRDWELPDREVHVETAAATPDRFTTAVVIAAYGESEPILGDSDRSLPDPPADAF